MASRKKKTATRKARTRAGRIAVVGRPNVGKSTLLNALLGERIAITSHRPQTTRDQIAGIVTRESSQFVFIDTPGVHEPRNRLGIRMNALAEDAWSQADAIVFVTDVPAEPSPEVRRKDEEIFRAFPPGIAVIVALNKIDRVKDKSKLLPLLTALGEAHPFAAIVPISAAKEQGLERLLGELERVLPESEFLYAEDELSDKPTRFFVSEFIREEVLHATREEVPHGVAVEVETWEEKRNVLAIGVVIHVDRESHKAIVIGRGGERLKKIGEAARKKIERLLGAKVHLKTWVRVTPGWYDKDAQMKELGIGMGGS